MNTGFIARSPAKLILSGEHAVVYGKPAIAMAINCYAESRIHSQARAAIFFNFRNLQYAKSFTLQTLSALKSHLQEQYYNFLEGRCTIREVLKKPFELLQYTVSNLLEKWNITLSEGLEICASSEIPMGCGMGSSAALVMSTLYALAHFFKVEFDPKRFMLLGKEAENLQHGVSSGLDLHLAMNGGCVRFQNGQAEKRALPKMPFFMVQTGVPHSTTGECVSKVAKHFKHSTIWEEFASVTESFDAALQQNNFSELQTCLRENHRLLVKLGVVPDTVQAFIRAIEKAGGAAKICGAGAIQGDKGGIVLIASLEDLTQTVRSYGFQLQDVQGDTHGTHLI